LLDSDSGAIQYKASNAWWSEAALNRRYQMLPYFFIIEYGGQEIDDPEGVVLPGDTAAIEYARRIIDDLRKERRPEDPEATIV
jgi:hypothetical protein